MSKIGLVIEGGGMKCAYSAGVLDAFLECGIGVGEKAFDYAIGVSAGSANMVSFLSRQKGRALRFYTTHIKEHGYFGVQSLLKTGNLFGLEYIYKTLSNSDGDDPLDYPVMAASPTDYEVVATDAITGKPAYFTSADVSQDHYEAVMASSAIPIACKPIAMNGRYYFDGGVSDSLPVHRALANGCDKLVVLSSKPRDYIKPPQKALPLCKLACHKYPNMVKVIKHRHLMYRQEQERMYRLEDDGVAFVFAPSEHLEMGTYRMDAEGNRALYDLGLQDFALQKEELLHFLEK